MSTPGKEAARVLAAANIVRDPKTGRIQKGSKGKPKGMSWKPKTRDQHSVLRGLGFTGGITSLLQLVPMAQENMAEAINRGDPTATAWLLSLAHYGAKDLPLQRVIPGFDFSSIDGVVKTGHTVMDMMARQELSLSQVDKFVTIAKNYIQLQGVAEVQRLQEMIERLEEERARGTGPKAPQILPPEKLPSWGRLREVDKPLLNGHDASAETEEAIRSSILE